MRPSTTPPDGARKRPRREEPSTSGARWLQLSDPLSLLAKASAPPWHGACVDGASSTQPVAWERAEAGDHWDHDVVWLPCSEGAAAAAIHRFSPRDAEAMSSMLGELHSQARAEMVAAGGESSDQASNVGGFHGERDLWSREAVQECALPWLVGSAVQQAAQAEAAELGRAPIATSADEAWFNALGPGGWNVLHTHPGTAYSGAFFVAAGGGGGCDCDDDGLAGRLVFVGDAPSLTEGRHDEQLRAPHLRRTARTATATATATAAAAAAAAAAVAAAERRFLVVDPRPGTCVVFPSFVPHFVLPTPPARPDDAGGDDGGGGGREAPAALRLSVAFNFGACDPVVAHAFVQPGRHGARVKLVLETVDLFGA